MTILIGIYLFVAVWFFGFGTAVLHSSFEGRPGRAPRALIFSALVGIAWPVIIFIMSKEK